MKLKSITNLNEIDGFFDLTETKFIFPKNPIRYNEYVIQQHEEMRMDNISNMLYSTPDYMDLLLFINDIINPFSLREGQVIYYPIKDDLVKFEYVSEDPTEIQKTFINKSKTKRNDKNRENSNDKEKSLPPTVNERKIEQVKVIGKNIVIGKGIFNS